MGTGGRGAAAFFGVAEGVASCGKGEGGGRVKSSLKPRGRGARATRALWSLLGYRNQGLEGAHRDAQGASREAVHIGGIDPDYVAVGVKNRASAAAMGGRGVIDQLAAHNISQMAVSGGRANQRQGSQLAGSAGIVMAVG